MSVSISRENVTEIIRLAYLAAINDVENDCEQWCPEGSQERAEELLEELECDRTLGFQITSR